MSVCAVPVREKVSPDFRLICPCYFASAVLLNRSRPTPAVLLAAAVEAGRDHPAKPINRGGQTTAGATRPAGSIAPSQSVLVIAGSEAAT